MAWTRGGGRQTDTSCGCLQEESADAASLPDLAQVPPGVELAASLGFPRAWLPLSHWVLWAVKPGGWHAQAAGLELFAKERCL